MAVGECGAALHAAVSKHRRMVDVNITAALITRHGELWPLSEHCIVLLLANPAPEQHIPVSAQAKVP